MIQIKLDAMTLSEPKVCDALSALIKAISEYGVTLNTSKRSHQLVFTNEQGSKVYLRGETLSMLVEGSTSLPSTLITALSRGVNDEPPPEISPGPDERHDLRQGEGEVANEKTAKGKTAKGKTAKGKTAKGKTAKGKTAKGKQSAVPSSSAPGGDAEEQGAQKASSKKPPLKRGKGAHTEKRPKRHLRAEEFSQWLQGLSAEQRGFVSALSTRGTLSVEESYQLLKVPKEQQTLKRLNGILGSIARWSSPEREASLVVPWDAKGGAYVWRPELIKP